MAILNSICAISAGAVLGALCRWVLGLALNAVFPPIPLGTLAANIIGGYCIGLAISIFSFFPEIAPEWRLLVITGFLGALTTFSTFSAEVGTLLQQQRFLMAMAAIALHVGGSLVALFLGMGTLALIKQFFN
ncbi:MAG: fluoride efflux transporter CrcB [Desulfobulbaceae bacterium]|jgi:CrcB protein|nr:fluoride efflux transporter CrcB [Desulfobulbaceae bacterium]